VVPYARGGLVSRFWEDVYAEAVQLKKEGVEDVTLLGQNVNAYGKDLYGEPRFVELLEAIAELGFRRVSFATSHPADFQPELVELISKYTNISRQLHLPVQSGSNRVLERMRRRYTREHYLEIVKLVRQIPDLSLTTDVIVGFPGETEADFEQTLELIYEAEFDHVFTFIFSPRPFTEASRYPDQIPEEIKKERFNKLTEVVKEVSLKRNLRLVGADVVAVVEGKSKTRGYLQARTESGKVILFKDQSHRPGQTVRLVVKDAGPYHLVGEIVGAEKTAI
jgi:tRNA-2-methylthio-N6-dimethylallyladenosine synthase